MPHKMKDRRVERTRNMLFDALLGLMIEKGYEAITVQDIIDRANVGRSTFYSHFLDKEDLLVGNIVQLRESLKKQMVMRSMEEEHGKYRIGFSLAMLQHVQNHQRLYTAIAGKQSGARVMHHMQRMLSDLVTDEITTYLSKSGPLRIPHDVAAEFVANTFMTLFTWWMDQKMPCSAEEIDRMFHKLVFSGISVPEDY